MSFPLSRLLIGSCSFALAIACSAAPEDSEFELGDAEQALTRDFAATPIERGNTVFAADIEAPATDFGTLAPVTAGPLFTARHTCEGSHCTCTGDPECNDMFSGSDCATGPKTAICQIRDEVPKCRCTRAAKAQ